jgi:hypothetical protein
LKNTKNRTKHNQLRVYWFEHWIYVPKTDTN